MLNGMHSLAVGPDGLLYLCDTFNNRLRRFDPKTGIVTAFAGTGTKGFAGDGGPATKAMLFNPESIAVDGPGRLVIADTINERIRVMG